MYKVRGPDQLRPVAPIRHAARGRPGPPHLVVPYKNTYVYNTYIYIYIYIYTARLSSEKGEVLLRGVGTLRHLLILTENSACQVPICAVAA